MIIDPNESARRLKLLKETIVRNEEQFDYLQWFLPAGCGTLDPTRLVAEVVGGRLDIRAALESDCGTVVCVAGWTIALFQDEVVPDPSRHITTRDVPGEAAHIFGLTLVEERHLFFPDEDDGDGYDTLEAAVEKLDELIAKKEKLALEQATEAAEERESNTVQE